MIPSSKICSTQWQNLPAPLCTQNICQQIWDYTRASRMKSRMLSTCVVTYKVKGKNTTTNSKELELWTAPVLPLLRWKPVYFNLDDNQHLILRRQHDVSEVWSVSIHRWRDTQTTTHHRNILESLRSQESIKISLKIMEMLWTEFNSHGTKFGGELL
jgi:hypothetical protein